MNKYLVPICDAAEPGSCWIETVIAPSDRECQEKIMQKLYSMYNIDEVDNYREFIKKADEENIIIGNIIDIEEL